MQAKKYFFSLSSRHHDPWYLLNGHKFMCFMKLSVNLKSTPAKTYVSTRIVNADTFFIKRFALINEAHAKKIQKKTFF